MAKLRRILLEALLPLLIAPSLPAAVSITIISNPPAQTFTVAGANCSAGQYVTPQVLTWTPGASCTVGFLSPQSAFIGAQYVFTSWQDGRAPNPRVITAPAQPTTYLANFTTQYFLTVLASPPEGGTVFGSGWYNQGSTATVTESPASGFRFIGWNGIAIAAPGTTAAQVFVNYPQTVYGYFSPKIPGPPDSYYVDPIPMPGIFATGINNFGQVAGGFSDVFLWTPVSANARTGSFADLTALNQPVAFVSLNDRGDIAGYLLSPATMFLWSPSTPNGTAGSTVPFTIGGSNQGTLLDINDFGQLSGFQNGRYFLWTPDVANGTTGTANTDPRFIGIGKINNFGQAIISQFSGSLFTPDKPNAATGTFTQIPGLPGSVASGLLDINDAGTIVGASCFQLVSGCDFRMFLWTPFTPHGTTGTTSEIVTPAGFVSMSPLGINSSGQVVGVMSQQNGLAMPILYSGGALYDLSELDTRLIGGSAVGINDAGQIVVDSNSGITLLTPTGLPQPSDLTITINHASPFRSGDVGDSWVLAVTNIGAGKTTGTVTFTDTPPFGFTPTSWGGPGWTCSPVNAVPLTCSRSDVLQPGNGYSQITLTGNVISRFGLTFVDRATVGGGGETNLANDSASDDAFQSATPQPDLSISITHTLNFLPSGAGGYSITVNNHGPVATTAAVTVTDPMPGGLTFSSITLAMGWDCSLSTPSQLSCTRSDPLDAGQSYPTIFFSVAVAANAPASISNTATVAGGGESNFTDDSATDTLALAVRLVTVTIGTSQPGLSFSVDGRTFSSAQTQTWVVGSPHILATTSPQALPPLTYTFLGWSDSGALSHVVTAPTASTTYTANFVPSSR